MDRNNDASPPVEEVISRYVPSSRIPPAKMARPSDRATRPDAPRAFLKVRKRRVLFSVRLAPGFPVPREHRAIRHPPLSLLARSAERGVSANGLFLRPMRRPLGKCKESPKRERGREKGEGIERKRE